MRMRDGLVPTTLAIYAVEGAQFGISGHEIDAERGAKTAAVNRTVYYLVEEHKGFKGVKSSKGSKGSRGGELCHNSVAESLADTVANVYQFRLAGQ